MSRFNQNSEGTKTVNLAGGEAYKQTPELELISILLTSFANDSFYRSANDTFDRLKELVRICDKKFATPPIALECRRRLPCCSQSSGDRR